MKKISFVSLVLCLNLIFAVTGRTGATFLTLDTGARILGLGGAGSAIINGAQSLIYNPSQLGWQNDREFTCSHSEHFQSIRYENIGFAYGKGNFGIGFLLRGLYLGGMEERTEPSQTPISTMNAYFLAPSFSLGKGISKNFALGANLKPVYQKIGNDNSFSLSLDLGSEAKMPIKGMNLGFSIIDLGTKVRFKDESYPLPTRMRFGMGYSLIGGRINLAFDLIKFWEEDFEYATGLEGRIAETAVLRIGYRGNLNGEEYNALACGFGLKAQDIDIDYAFVPYSSLGATHTFSISYFWGRGKRTRREKELMVTEKFLKMIKEKAGDFYNQGIQAKNAGMRDEAFKKFQTSVLWYPSYQNPIPYIDSLRKEKFNKYLMTGYNCYKENNYVEAIYQFAQALRIDSLDKKAKGWLKAGLNMLIKASTEKITQKSEREKISYYIYQGGKYFSEKNYVGAIKEWYKALIIDSTQVAVKRLIDAAKIKIKDDVGRFTEEKRFYRALSRVEEYLAFEPKSQEFLNKKEQLTKEVSRLIAEHIDEGIKSFNNENYAVAKVEFNIVALIEPKNLTARHYLGKIKSVEFEVSIEELIRLFEKGVEAYSQGNYEFALEYYKGIHEFKPDFLEIHKNIDCLMQKILED